MRRQYAQWLLIVALGWGVFACGQADRSLPGTQPAEFASELDAAAQCAACHAQTRNGDADPMFSWQSSMMAHAARDPIFLAAMAIANQDIPDSGALCLRCHVPRGFIAGRTTPADGSALEDRDRDGVSCTICHRLVDPRTAKAEILTEHVPPGLGNAMMVLARDNVTYGPYGDDQAAVLRSHKAERTEFIASGELCGTCHDVSNPYLADDPTTQPPYAYGHIERTYSEWKLSAFADMGREGSCQSCHLPVVPDGGYPTKFPDAPHRDYFVEHGPPGGSTWVQQLVWRFGDQDELDRRALERGVERARALLKTAATLDLSFPEAGQVKLRVTNETGHKLPTGYPEGRRMWVNVRFLDADGQVLVEHGRYAERAFTVYGQKEHLPTLLDPNATRVYEMLPAMSPAQAGKYDKEPGPSFFFILNDIIAKDNRIPPRGFTNAAFKQRQCEPIGATYADGQHWDEIAWSVPDGTATVAARLMYEAVTTEYIVFFTEHDHTSPWGKRIYEAWKETGHCPPETVAEVTAAVPTP